MSNNLVFPHELLGNGNAKTAETCGIVVKLQSWLKSAKPGSCTLLPAVHVLNNTLYTIFSALTLHCVLFNKQLTFFSEQCIL